jgi:predicted Zn-dependent protease
VIELLLQAESALSVGLLDRAEALYQQVVGADPRNSIAVVGLARVALERSDEVGALTLARRALVIDPENNAAQRMVLRLEEVLRVRGVAVAPMPAEPQPTLQPSADAAPQPELEHRSYLDRLLRRRGSQL